MKKLIVLIAIIFVASTASAKTITHLRVLEAKNGNVVFDHITHIKENCIECHLEINNAGGMNKAFAHEYCQRCHKVSNGPTKCGECHKK